MKKYLISVTSYLFLEIPKKNNTTYGKHLTLSLVKSVRHLVKGMGLIVNAFFPRVFKNIDTVPHIMPSTSFRKRCYSY